MSVLSALEGLSVATPALTAYILPAAIGVLTALFFIQKHGTGNVGKFFGPVMLVWFSTLAILGLISIIKHVITSYSIHYTKLYEAQGRLTNVLIMVLSGTRRSWLTVDTNSDFKVSISYNFV